MLLQAAQGAPSGAPTKVLFIVGILVILSVVVFTTAVIITLLRRSDRRRAEEEKLAAIGTATARILHQIKNPLQTIVLHADILQDERIVSEQHQRREVCEAIVGESQRLVAMLDELSVYASGSRRTLNRRPVRLDDLVRQVADVEARESAETGLAVDSRRIGEATVNGDAYYLRQVFENLVRNAREAMEGQEKPPRVEVSVERLAGNAEVRVTDNGPGIAPDDLQRIFQPFVSTKGKGMGLGLAICREIVEGHGGRMDVDSTPGEGTTFLVTLPLHSESPALTAA
ncbi:HAMP domain-containing sensor histidine kinase [Longimicrobium sp.]|uniref:sensor histidine kinase n=1 Tax=Longimicrobium sp. TaxID=2029185 RepID=UPI002BA18214|nr:HAMP domain-containing sensor histidine kinase [Longimicrobium sp.]HSU16906.1 HAMP domain-containing sensor histidine kinase [Longimicrobium sp.]